MIDIHCHILYGVDDGSPDEDTSRKLVDRMSQIGVTDIIVTPHYRRHMFAYPSDKIEEAYRIVREYASGKGINLYPGCEYHVDHEIFDHLKNGRIHTLADTDYVLTEYSYSSELDRITEYTRELVMRGWRPVIAHAERYEVFQRKPAFIEDVIDAGGQIQVNADSVLGLEGRIQKKAVKKMLERGFVEYIASDAHDLTDRATHMDECYSYIRKKYGEELSERLFEHNPRKILRARRNSI